MLLKVITGAEGRRVSQSDGNSKLTGVFRNEAEKIRGKDVSESYNPAYQQRTMERDLKITWLYVYASESYKEVEHSRKR